MIPLALQVLMYVASLAIIVTSLVVVVSYFHFRKQLERIVGAVEELAIESKPLAQETRILVRRLSDLSGRAQEQWTEVERIIDTARHWSERTNHLVDEIGSIVEPPIFAATHGIRRLSTGLGMFVQMLLNRNQRHQPKRRES